MLFAKSSLEMLPSIQLMTYVSPMTNSLTSFGAQSSYYNRLIMGLAESKFEKYVNELFK